MKIIYLDQYFNTPLMSGGTRSYEMAKRLIELIKLSNGNAYISGKGGQNYQDVELFNKNGIDLTVLEYVPKEYPQLWGEFVPGLSIVDFIFNCGCENFAFFKTELVSIS